MNDNLNPVFQDIVNAFLEPKKQIVEETAAFPHGYAKIKYDEYIQSTKIYEMNGYVRAMNQILTHIGQVTQWLPENKFIDGKILTDRIHETCRELQPIIENELNKLK